MTGGSDFQLRNKKEMLEIPGDDFLECLQMLEVNELVNCNLSFLLPVL